MVSFIEGFHCIPVLASEWLPRRFRQTVTDFAITNDVLKARLYVCTLAERDRKSNRLRTDRKATIVDVRKSPEPFYP